MEIIYFDNNATTAVDPLVLETMLPYFSKSYGNASSKTHFLGREANEAVSAARLQVANSIGAESSEIYFTSGSTESINLALKGVFNKYHTKGKHIVTAKTEHKCVLDVCKYLESKGAEVTYLDCDRHGRIDLQQLENVIGTETVAVCLMLANNETGVINPIAEIAEIVHKKNSILICDTTQAIGKTRVDVNELGIDVAFVSAHKIYGPKGAGAIYVRRKNPRVALEAFIHGGGQENDLRSGTLNVPGIVGLGKACEMANESLWTESKNISLIRALIEQGICELLPAKINGDTRYRLANTTNICFENISANKFISEMQQFAMATGSACTSALPEPSHVLMAMGLTEAEAKNSIRISIGKYNTKEEAMLFLEKVKEKFL